MYYESRIPKIPKYFIENTILNSTWLADRNNEYCKPLDDDELDRYLEAYSGSKIINNDLKKKIYEGTVWYAAYCACFAYKSYCIKFPVSEYEDYLSYCLERLLLKINDWDPKLSNGATFYTRVLSDIKWSVKTYLLDDFGEGLCKRPIVCRASAAINKMLFLGYTFDSALELDDDYFEKNFKIKKHLFVDYLKHSQITSGNMVVNLPNSTGACEIFDFVEDDYNSTFSDRVIVKLTVEEVCELARAKFKEKERYFFIWRDYKTGNYSLDDLAKVYYNPPCTRERVRQIVMKVDRSLKESRKFIEFKNEYMGC